MSFVSFATQSSLPSSNIHLWLRPWYTSFGEYFGQTKQELLKSCMRVEKREFVQDFSQLLSPGQTRTRVDKSWQERVCIRVFWAFILPLNWVIEGERWWELLASDRRLLSDLNWFKFWWELMRGDEKWWNLMRGDERWWEVMRGDERWWEMMRLDGRWWEVMRGDERWWEVMRGDER